MNFVSPGFALFISIVFLLYWFVFKKNVLHQNFLLLLASLFFYAWFNLLFLGLLIFSIILNYILGKAIAGNKNKWVSKWLLVAGIMINLGILFFFKYIGWGNAISTSRNLGHSEDIFLPLGISFYTFQVLGYIIDVYNEEIKASNDILAFSTYVAYFPKIASGPIEPAKKFLPQILIKRDFDYALAADGMRQILWGVFTKLVIANNCASFAQPVFENHREYTGSTLLLASFFYLFQVYCDFSGYSNIAIGVSKLFGIQLSRNFHAPFFSTNIREYWQKWHMTLTHWMLKYVFTPLSFLLRSLRKSGAIISVIITFVLVGLWHGAAWTFVVFGLLHGLYFIPLLLFPKRTIEIGKENNSRLSLWSKYFQMAGLFLTIMFTCIFFGSSSLTAAFEFISKIFSNSLFSSVTWPPFTGAAKAIVTIFFILVLLTVEWIQRPATHELQIDNIKSPYFRHCIYLAIIFAILLFGSVMHIKFLYSQF